MPGTSTYRRSKRAYHMKRAMEPSTHWYGRYRKM
jgi:hypothetical protein